CHLPPQLFGQVVQAHAAELARQRRADFRQRQGFRTGRQDRPDRSDEIRLGRGGERRRFRGLCHGGILSAWGQGIRLVLGVPAEKLYAERAGLSKEAPGLPRMQQVARSFADLLAARIRRWAFSLGRQERGPPAPGSLRNSWRQTMRFSSYL